MAEIIKMNARSVFLSLYTFAVTEPGVEKVRRRRNRMHFARENAFGWRPTSS